MSGSGSGSAAKVEKKIKEVAKEDFNKISALAQEAATSKAYLYPFKGILYFVSHRSLWKPLVSKLAPTMTLGVAITVGMFLFTYLPQAAAMAFVEGPVAPISAALLVLSESSTLFSVLSKTFLIDDALTDTFDGTLVARDQTSIVAANRTVKARGDPIQKLGKLVKKPFAKFAPAAIVRYFMYLPLNFIPVVGTVLFIIMQGRRSGPIAHTRYFQLKSMSGATQEEFVEQRKGAYTSFGIVATLLEMVPFANIFFAFTNTTAAALWAADMEKKSTTAPALRQTVANAQ